MSSIRNRRPDPKLTNYLPPYAKGGGYHSFSHGDQITKHDVAKVRMDDLGSSEHLRYRTQDTHPVTQSWRVTNEHQGVGVLMIEDIEELVFDPPEVGVQGLSLFFGKGALEVNSISLGLNTSLAEFGAPKRRIYALLVLAHFAGGGADGGEAASIADGRCSRDIFLKFGGYNFVGLCLSSPTIGYMFFSSEGCLSCCDNPQN
jgi:hypothetical protein